MDLSAKERIVKEIEKQGLDKREVAVPLDLFFEGNDDLGSIGCNLGDEQPSIATFYRTLKELESRDDVYSVWVRICFVEEEEYWPHTDTVYLIASLSLEEIERSLENLLCDEIAEGWMYGKPDVIPDITPDVPIYSVWWD
ncbi:MAG: hypothetical protein AAF542_08435 [Pseudomonadota bacterium]